MRLQLSHTVPTGSGFFQRSDPDPVQNGPDPPTLALINMAMLAYNYGLDGVLLDSGV
jgi:hypothetical protein